MALVASKPQDSAFLVRQNLTKDRTVTCGFGDWVGYTLEDVLIVIAPLLAFLKSTFTVNITPAGLPLFYARGHDKFG